MSGPQNMPAQQGSGFPLGRSEPFCRQQRTERRLWGSKGGPQFGCPEAPWLSLGRDVL